MLAGSRPALARVLSRVENEGRIPEDTARELADRIGRAWRIGVTGPPGAGKSSLVNAYVKLLRKTGVTVGVIAVDPTSPFSGGALLGDRIRMSSIALDEGVFVRSLATRGGLGGLVQAAGDMADVLDACGFDIVLFETVGVGQSELDIVEYADTTSVVLVPESGDGIQAMKAGLMEIADVFVVNKSDRTGADRFAANLKAVMQIKRWGNWKPPVVMTTATEGKGIEELLNKLQEHYEYQKTSGGLGKRRRERLERYVERVIDHRLTEEFWTASRRNELRSALEDNRPPHEIVRALLNGG